MNKGFDAVHWMCGQEGEVAVATNEELVRRIQAGENELTLELWEQVRRFIAKKAYAFVENHANTGRVEPEDLIQSGYLALADAVKTYNGNAGKSFIGYLTFYLMRYFRKEAGILTSRRDAIMTAISLDAPLAGENGNVAAIGDMIPSTETDFESIIDELDNRNLINVVFGCMGSLEPVQREIITQVYLQRLSYKDIAAMHGITQQEANHIREKALDALKRKPAIKRLTREIYLDERTPFYRRKGYKAFATSFSSVVEDAVIKLEQLKSLARKNT